MADRQFSIAWEGGEDFGIYLAEKDEQFGAGLKAAGLVGE